MSIHDITAKITEMQELKRMAEELNSEIESLQDEIKAYMGENETLTAGQYKVTYKAITSTRIDTTALKKALPDVAQRFTKTTTSRRFTIQ